MTRIDPLIDVAFKIIFEEEELLKDFLNSFLDFKIQQLKVFKDRPTQKETVNEKQSFLDLQAITDDGKIINIEVQLRKQDFFPKRSVYYTSKLVTEGFEIGGNYQDIPKVLAINILDFVLFSNISSFVTHFVNYEREQEFILQDAPEYYCIEMPKIAKNQLSINNKFHRWLLFFRPEKHATLYKEVLKMDNIISKAEEKVERIQQDPEMKKLYDDRFKQLTDEANRLSTARNEGREEGYKEAYKEAQFNERKNTVKSLLDEGWSLERIEETFGYDPKKYL